MKKPLLILSALALGLVGCMSEKPIAKIAPAVSSDGSSYCFVGMD